MPMGFGGNESVEHEAWLGDKYLGCAVAKVLVARGVKGKDNLTRRHSALVSNANLAKRWDDVHPEHMRRLLPPPGLRARQHHDCGTMVEACVKPHSRPLTLRKLVSTHPWRECPSPPRPSGEWLPWAEGLQAVSSN